MRSASKALLFILLVLAVVAVGADAFARTLAERALARELAQTYQLDERPGTDVDGWPFVVRAAMGEVPRVTVTTEDIGRGGLRARRIELALDNVQFDPVEVAQGRIEGVRTSGGTGRVVFGAGQLEREVSAVAGIDVDIRFDGGRVIVTAAGQVAEGELAVEDGALVVGAEGLSTSVALPDFGGRVNPAGVSVGEGEATIDLDVGPGRIAELLAR